MRKSKNFEQRMKFDKIQFKMFEMYTIVYDM